MPRPLSSLHNLIAPRVLGVPIPLMDQTILRAATDFCRETGLYQEVTSQRIVSGRSEYDIEVPQGAVLARIVDVWCGDRQLAPVALDDVDHKPAFDNTAAVGTPSLFYTRDPASPAVALFPRPDDNEQANSRLTVRAQYEIAHNATVLPDFLVANHAFEVASGAIGYLSMLPGQSFTNPQQAQIELNWFNAAISRGKAAARMGKVRRSLYVSPRRFA